MNYIASQFHGLSFKVDGPFRIEGNKRLGYSFCGRENESEMEEFVVWAAMISENWTAELLQSLLGRI